MNISRYILLALWVIALATMGCLFDTRDAEPPASGGSSCAAIALDTPEAVFEAITCAIESEQDAAYERVISQRFVFSPTLEDSTNQTWGGAPVYENWDKSVELQVFGLMLGNAQFLSVDFAPSLEINQTTFVRFRVPYRLNVVNTTAPTDTVEYAGVAFFDVRNEGGNWRLTFWDEIETVPNLPTWGFLKGLLRQQLNP